MLPNENILDLIYGKKRIERIVSIEADMNQLVLFKEIDGKIDVEFLDNTYWFITNKAVSRKQHKLNGSQYYQFIAEFPTFEEREDARLIVKRNNIHYYQIYQPKEASMVKQGLTSFLGMTPKDVSALFFDIETTGLVKNDQSKIILISNTYRDSLGNITKRLFSYDEFNSEGQMIDSWCEWVREMNPSLMVGHNIFGFDLPYLQYCAEKNNTTLKLGRDGSDIKFNSYEQSFRKDGSQDINYYNALIYGREIIDTMFLAIKYDIGRKYESYSLKSIIHAEGLEKEGRQFYQAGEIRQKYQIPSEFIKIKQYAIDDADDTLQLFDLMIPAYFYFAQSVSKPFQSVINSATGSQINNMMVRSYLQRNHSIPLPTDVIDFQGGISLGIPGIYKNALKWDLASAYPNTIIQYNLYDERKDPDAHFLQMVQYFTKERIKNKKLAKETNNKYYKDMEQAQKIIINSFFGFCGAPGLQFNSPKIASKITEYCRSYLSKAIEWATSQSVDYWKNKAGLEQNPDEDQLNDC